MDWHRTKGVLRRLRRILAVAVVLAVDAAISTRKSFGNE
jgi:hypothetical protein